MIEIINKPLLLHLVGYLCYWQMGFNSVFKGLSLLIAVLFKIVGTVCFDSIREATMPACGTDIPVSMEKRNHRTKFGFSIPNLNWIIQGVS